MKVAIHHREGSFSNNWIKYCLENNINYSVVDAYSTEIIDQLRNYDVFLWHFDHVSYKDAIAAKSILYSLEKSGIKVYPNLETCWHFDDKIAQKYLLESIEAPLIPSHVFYSKEDAITWAKTTQYPKVFKLKGGAGGTNVKLVHNFSQCARIINTAFGKGFSPYDNWNAFKDRIKKSNSLSSFFKAIGRVIVPNEFVRMGARQKGYVYFQDYIPNNDSDIRIIVINKIRAYGFRRMNRKGDFRASGSGIFEYDGIPLEAVRVAMNTAKRLSMQSVAFDFVMYNDQPVIVEMSYGFGTKGSSKCKGYWTEDLKWKEGPFFPIPWILQSVISDANPKGLE